MTRVTEWLCGLVACVLILDTIIVVSVGAGINLGTLWPATAGTILLFWVMTRPIWERVLADRFRFLRRTLVWGTAIGACLFLMLEILIISAAVARLPERLDCVIVLGAGLRGDRPTLTLRGRLDRAREVAEQYPAARILVSGGQGPGETITEAKAMMDYLVGQGVSRDRILMEDRSTSTMENLVFSRKVLEANGRAQGDRIGVISSEFHLLRVRMLARRAGLELHPIGARSPWYLYPNNFVREAAALVKSFVLDRP